MTRYACTAAPMTGTPEYLEMLKREYAIRAEIVAAKHTPDGALMLQTWLRRIERAERAIARGAK